MSKEPNAISTKDRECMVLGYKRFIEKGGLTVRDGYASTMITLYCAPNLRHPMDPQSHEPFLPPHERPSLNQFRYFVMQAMKNRAQK